MKDVILASLIAFVLAALIANNPMPPAKSPLGVGSVNHTVYGTKEARKPLSRNTNYR
jgi:predicted transcriptional regulator